MGVIREYFDCPPAWRMIDKRKARGQVTKPALVIMAAGIGSRYGGLKQDERWAGITYRADKPTVQQYITRLVRQGLYPKKLWG